MHFYLKNLKDIAEARQKWLENWRDDYIKILSEEPNSIPPTEKGD